MNDPGLDEPILDSAGQVNEKYGKDKDDGGGGDELVMDEEADEKNFLMPAKWWYASTAFPLAAGTFGPMANAFSICALVENWRVEIPKGGTEEHGIDIKDPEWLIAVNAVSLVFALIANMSLLMNMARRLPFKIAQPVTIGGFWIASVLLIGLIAKAGTNFHKPGVRDQALTQAYYYAVFAAGLYQMISYLMLFTAWGAWAGHYSKEFKLTMAQRTLMLQTISYLVYLLLGALVYSKIEGWKFLDAVYWADFTTLTIGIGDDFTPQTHLGRGLLFPFALGGIIVLGLVVGSIRSLVLDRSKKKMSARLTEKVRRKVVRQVRKAADSDERKKIVGLDMCTADALANNDNVTELERRKAEFIAMRRVQEMAEVKHKWYSLATSISCFAFLWFIGALVFKFSEVNQEWSYFESLYFAYTSLLTIGYGDFQPISNSGKPFFVFWSLLAIPTLTILISDMGDTVVKSIKDLTIWLGEITVLPSDEGGIKDRLKFGVSKLTKGRIDLESNGPLPTGEDAELDEEIRRFKEMNPELTHMPSREDGKKHHHGKKRHEKERSDSIVKDFENAEKQSEAEARKRGDTIAEDDHHYRHILISQIRRVWTDSSQATPKKYSYAEWAYYLRLLGEDESDPRFHRAPPVKLGSKLKAGQEQVGESPSDSKPGSPTEETSSDGKKLEEEQEGKKDTDTVVDKDGVEREREGLGNATGGGADAAGDGDALTKWSWIGTRSPLMGEKHEAEWLLDKMFTRLEQSLKDHWEVHRKEGKGMGQGFGVDDLDKERQRRENHDDGREEERAKGVQSDSDGDGIEETRSRSRPSSGTLDGDDGDEDEDEGDGMGQVKGKMFDEGVTGGAADRSHMDS